MRGNETSRQGGVPDAAGAQEIGRAATERPAEASLALRRALELRALLERIFLALVAREDPDPADVEAVNAGLACARRRIVRTAGGYRWVWCHRPDNELEALLWPVLLSVAELLTSKYLKSVRRCAGRGCDLLFVDRTRGKPRKWCSDKSCGERTRARRRYYATILGTRAGTSGRAGGPAASAETWGMGEHQPETTKTNGRPAVVMKRR